MRAIEIISMFAVAGLVLFLGDLVAQPIPIPALTVTLGGLIGLWIRSGGRRNLLWAGLVIGLVVGLAIHLWSHYVEGRMNPPEGLLYHFVVNTSLGLLIAGVAVVAAAMVSYLIETYRKKVAG